MYRYCVYMLVMSILDYSRLAKVSHSDREAARGRRAGACESMGKGKWLKASGEASFQVVELQTP
jgi:hypothetical protein